MRVETYDAVQGRWDCHSLDTIQQVERNDVVLFRKLPNGIGGPRMTLDNCPGLREEIEKLKCSKLGQSHLVTTLNSPRKRGADATETGPMDLEEAAHRKKQSRRDLILHVNTQQNNKEIPPRASTISDVVDNLTRELAESEKLKHRPICGKSLKRGGERLWPTTFFAVDVIEGFQRMEALVSQRRPRIFAETAFEMVYGLPFKKATYTLHHGLYVKNPVLVKKYKPLGRTEDASWKNFVTEVDTVIEIQDSPKIGQSLVPAPPVVDAKTMCPYCDEPWPSNPSQQLIEIRRKIDAISSPDPGPHSDNPNHRRTRPAVRAAAVCVQHRFETSVLPEGIAAGYPQDVDFGDLPRRIRALKPALDELVEDASPSPFYDFFETAVTDMGWNRAIGTPGQYRFAAKYGHGTG